MNTTAETAQIPVGFSPLHQYSIVHICRNVNTTWPSVASSYWHCTRNNTRFSLYSHLPNILRL